MFSHDIYEVKYFTVKSIQLLLHLLALLVLNCKLHNFSRGSTERVVVNRGVAVQQLTVQSNTTLMSFS